MTFLRKLLIISIVASILSIATFFYLKESHSILYKRAQFLFNKSVCTYQFDVPLTVTQLNKINNEIRTASFQEVRINFNVDKQNYSGLIDGALFQIIPQLITCEFNRSSGLFLRIGDEKLFFICPILVKQGLQNFEIIETYDNFIIKIDDKVKFFLNANKGNNFILNKLPFSSISFHNYRNDVKINKATINYVIGRLNWKVFIFMCILGVIFWFFFIAMLTLVINLWRKLWIKVNVNTKKALLVATLLLFFNAIFFYNLPKLVFVFFTFITSALAYIFWRIFYTRNNNCTGEISKDKINFWMCLCVVIGTIFMFNFLIFNKFFPITEGWWSVMAYYINQGKLPYRDFYLCLPPLYPYQIATFTKFFGYNFINLRFAGIVVMMLFATNLYLIMTLFFPYFISAILAISAILIVQSFTFLVAYDFNMLIFLYSTYIVLFLLYAMDKTASYKKRNLFCLLTGVMCSLVVLTKQNAGPIIVFASMAVFIIDLIVSQKKSPVQIIMYFIGFFIPVFFTLFWLLKNNIFNNFVQQVFLDAINSKGRISLVLFQWVGNLFTKERIFGISLICNAFFIFLNLNFKNYKQNLDYEFKYWNRNIKYSLLMVLPLPVVIIAAYCFNGYSVKILGNINFRFFIENILPVSLAFSCLSMIIYGCYSIFYKKVYTSMFLMLFYLAVLSTGIIFYSTTSARDISLLTLFLPFILFLGYIIFCNSRFNLVKPIVYSLIIIIAWYASAKKFNVPYQWFGDEQLNVQYSVYPSKNKLLKGFYLSEDREKFLTDISSTLISKSNINDSVFVFPHYPVLYLMSNRFPTTFALFHWIDVASDRVCRDDAKRLISRPPKLIVYETDTIGIQESVFREFNRSGQRDIIDAIEMMVKQKKYRMLKRLDNLKILERIDRDSL